MVPEPELANESNALQATLVTSTSATAADLDAWIGDVRGSTSISIVMPCLNEEDTVAICVRKALAYLRERDLQGEVLVVDNGSTDESARLASEAGARVVYEARRGYGAALRRGFNEAQGNWLVMGDCDDTYDFTRLDDLLEPLTRGYDMVVGNRFRGEMAPRAMTWSHRYIGTPVLSSLLRVFTGTSLGDSQCGLRAFTREARDRLDLQTDGMELASEMIMKAARRSLNMCEVAIPYGERLGETKLNTVRDGWRHLRFLLMMTPGVLFTLPGALLTAAGLVTLLASLPAGAIEVSSLTWQPVFAGAIFLVVGLNALLLGFSSQLYMASVGIIEEDGGMLRFGRKYFGLESLLALGGLLMLSGVLLDLMLALGATGGVSQLGVAAIAQAAIISGSNAVLVGFLTSLILHDAGSRNFGSEEMLVPDPVSQVGSLQSGDREAA